MVSFRAKGVAQWCTNEPRICLSFLENRGKTIAAHMPRTADTNAFVKKQIT